MAHSECSYVTCGENGNSNFRGTQQLVNFDGSHGFDVASTNVCFRNSLKLLVVTAESLQLPFAKHVSGVVCRPAPSTAGRCVTSCLSLPSVQLRLLLLQSSEQGSSTATASCSVQQSGTWIIGSTTACAEHLGTCCPAGSVVGERYRLEARSTLVTSKRTSCLQAAVKKLGQPVYLGNLSHEYQPTRTVFIGS